MGEIRIIDIYNAFDAVCSKYDLPKTSDGYMIFQELFYENNLDGVNAECSSAAATAIKAVQGFIKTVEYCQKGTIEGVLQFDKETRKDFHCGNPIEIFCYNNFREINMWQFGRAEGCKKRRK